MVPELSGRPPVRRGYRSEISELEVYSFLTQPEGGEGNSLTGLLKEFR